MSVLAANPNLGLVWRRARLLLLIVLLLLVYGPLGAQELRPETALNAGQMLDLLREQPALLEKLKTAAAEKLSAAPAAAPVDPSAGLKKPKPSAAVPAPASDAQPQPLAPGGGPLTGEEPDAERRAIPHANLPSLAELYRQLPASGGKVTRFGSGVFQKGTGNAEELPMDLPAGPDYVLGPGDVLILNLWGGRSERIERMIDRQGQVALPEAAPIAVSGMTIAQAQEAIRRALAGQFRDERVEISLGRVRSVRVYVVGDVERPGAYDISSLSTPLNALYAAGGPLGRGSLRRVRHLRGARLVAEVDLYDFLLKGVRGDVERLLPGDTILVPPAGAEVTVAGMVRRPAIYEIKGGETLTDMLELAGRPLVQASLSRIRVERIEAHRRRTMLEASVDEATVENVGGFLVADGDHILVSPILPYNEQSVFLEGHVFRPGRYAWHEGMKLSELLTSGREVMPEPAARAEIVRLRAPDYRPETIEFSLTSALEAKQAIALEAFDVVRVFGRYEVDAPRVTIRGQVLRPGEYPLTEGLTVAGLVRMAGGLDRSAYRAAADLASHRINDAERVEVELSEVALGKALEGDRAADVRLKPGDLVGIRQITGWHDIGSAVTVSGEVGFAGTYGIENGERLSSVLRRAGGLRPEAYPEGAVLERKQVGELAERSRQDMIRRLESAAPSVQASATGGQEQLSLIIAMQFQQQQVLAALRSRTGSPRLVVHLSGRLEQWANTPADLELRAGDTLFIPKRPGFVLIAGQVYNPAAITYSSGKDASWYLEQAGGATRWGSRRDAYVVRADGSVVGHGDPLGQALQPGDAVVVPEKIVGGPPWWRTLLAAAQLMSSVAITGSAAHLF